MAEVTIEIAGRTYRVGCGDGEEQHLMGLANKIDAEARELSRNMTQISEARLLLMTCLMLADRLHESEAHVVGLTDELEAAIKRSEIAGSGGDLFNPEREAELASEVSRLAERLEALASTIAPNGAANG